ncbi:MAG: trypsin-like peptidase domain-containing protein [Bacilli bacterium]|nr:trypsin-like peptidase domain-containing protein [Bacilli bacterium]MDD4407200.1 trypsin-like peptidase domain-containing protein [Bacilli bacterium]
MFKKAIEVGSSYTRPLLTGKVIYNNRKIINLINTLIILNKNGDVLTSSQVADFFLISTDINEVFNPIIEEMKGLKKKDVEKLEKKFGIRDNTVIKLHNIIVQITPNVNNLTIIKHPYLDLAIIRFESINKDEFNNFPIFNTEDKAIGTSICNLGFAFPNYDAFSYDIDNEKIIITNKIMNFPLFPLNGIITRNIIDSNGSITMFETSIPCLPGQNGGPVLNINGEIIGLLIGNKKIVDRENPDIIMNLGNAISSSAIIDFLENHNISYNKKQ